MINQHLPPISLTNKQDNFCKRLDLFYLNSQIDSSASNKYIGALFASSRECRNNPDWLSQAANSLREILYPFWKSRNNSPNKNVDVIREFGSVRVNQKHQQELGRLYNLLSDLTHHKFVSGDKYFRDSQFQFEELLLDFENILNDALTRQIDIHQEIDAIVHFGPPMAEAELNLISVILAVINLNADARQYFFSKADEGWLSWLWKNGFLDSLKDGSDNLTQTLNSPESLYLKTVAKIVPHDVVDIMIEVLISKDNFNSEVLGRFIWICAFLPADQLVRMIEKIRKEEWIKFSPHLSLHGFDYDYMFQTLKKVEDYKSLLKLAEAILLVRPSHEYESNSRYLTPNPFYSDQLSDTAVFEHIVSVDDVHIELALNLTTNILSQIILLGGLTKKKSVFKVQDLLDLSEIDFCTIEFSQNKRVFPKDVLRELAAVIKTLTRRISHFYIQDNAQAKRIYNEIFKPLPDSRTTWRLKLYALSLNPSCLKSDFKNSLNRLFKVDQYYDLISGSEYENALQKGFSTLSENDKKHYVKRIIKYFTKNSPDNEEVKWQSVYGSRLLSIILTHLTENEKLTAQKAGFSLDASLKPGTKEIGRSGIIRARGPVSPVEFNKLPIQLIAEKLRHEWTPETLSELEENDDVLRPLNAEGLGKILQSDILIRLKDYCQVAKSFFERGVLDLHYTYSFLAGIQDAIKNNKELLQELNWDNIIGLLLEIRESGLNIAFDNKEREVGRMYGWLANGEAVHREMADVLLVLLQEAIPIIESFSYYRGHLFLLVEYLLSYPDPTPQDEELRSAKIKIWSNSDKAYRAGSSFSLALNSVRGRAYQVFVVFCMLESKRPGQEDIIKISPDLKKIYEEVLDKENTRALMFLYGNNLPFFYSLDSNWIHQLLPQIFTSDFTKQHLYIASWEGYLANDLYLDMFNDPNFRKLYERGLALTNVKEREREESIDSNEGIAHHFALAYLNDDDFGLENPLFKMFWAKNDPEQHADFVRFIGRYFVHSNGDTSSFVINERADTKQRLMDLWDYLLNRNSDPYLLKHIGFWINLEKNIFSAEWLGQHVKRSLQKTGGILEWNEGLIDSVEELSEKAPTETIEIVKLYLLNGVILERPMYFSFRMKDEWFNAFRILYSNPRTRAKTTALINELIQKGGHLFWKLKEILKNQEI